MSRSASPAGIRGEQEGVRPLAPAEFEQIRQLAYRAFGLELKSGKEELVSARLRKLVLMHGFRNYQEYYDHVCNDSTGRSLAAMIDALATNHTSFLREPDHFDFLKRRVLPRLVGRGLIHLWCAACSTGEEVWTLACILNDAMPAARTQIAATDISNKALQVASSGFYPTERCHSIPPEWRRRYFTAASGALAGMTVSPKLRQQAVFRRLNLIEEFSWPRPFPLIFCRNVMIYFDRATQERVVRKLAACLEPGGYLFVGHAESLTRVSHPLEYIQPAVYRKPDAKETRWNRSL